MARYLPISEAKVPTDIHLMAKALGMNHQKTYRRAGRECFLPEVNSYPAGVDDEHWDKLSFFGRARRYRDHYEVTRLGMDEVERYFGIRVIANEGKLR